MALPSPDDVKTVLALPFVVTYWPLIAGGVAALVLMMKGKSWIAAPVAGLFVLLFAWRSGWLN